MKCQGCVDDLIDYADGEICAERRAAVEAHLDVCPACGRFLGEVREAATALRSPVADPGEAYFESLTRRVMAHVREGGADSPMARVRRWFASSLWRPVAAMAPVAAALALAIYMAVGGGLMDRGPNQDENARIESLVRRYSPVRQLRLSPISLPLAASPDQEEMVASGVYRRLDDDADMGEAIRVETDKAASQTAFAANAVDLSEDEIEQLNAHLTKALEGWAI